jgi:hypothetical protein
MPQRCDRARRFLDGRIDLARGLRSRSATAWAWTSIRAARVTSCVMVDCTAPQLARLGRPWKKLRLAGPMRLLRRFRELYSAHRAEQTEMRRRRTGALLHPVIGPWVPQFSQAAKVHARRFAIGRKVWAIAHRAWGIGTPFAYQKNFLMAVAHAASHAERNWH